MNLMVVAPREGSEGSKGTLGAWRMVEFWDRALCCAILCPTPWAGNMGDRTENLGQIGESRSRGIWVTSCVSTFTKSASFLSAAVHGANRQRWVPRHTVPEQPPSLSLYLKGNQEGKKVKSSESQTWQGHKSDKEDLIPGTDKGRKSASQRCPRVHGWPQTTFPLLLIQAVVC